MSAHVNFLFTKVPIIFLVSILHEVGGLLVVRSISILSLFWQWSERQFFLSLRHGRLIEKELLLALLHGHLDSENLGNLVSSKQAEDPV